MDSNKIASIGIRQEIYDRLELPIQIQSTLGEELSDSKKNRKTKKVGLEDCMEDPNMRLSTEYDATRMVNSENLGKDDNIQGG